MPRLESLIFVFICHFKPWFLEGKSTYCQAQAVRQQLQQQLQQAEQEAQQVMEEKEKLQADVLRL